MAPPTKDVEHVPLVIVGGGFAGVGLAVRLKQAGVHDFTILERANALGGVWRDNTYPGCACDVPSALYSYSFAPNPDWSRVYATQPEILAYLQAVAAEHCVGPHVRLGTELLDARWDDDARRWQLQTTAGPLTTTVLVGAQGLFGDPVLPDIPGRATFAGTTFHSARWDHTQDLTGRRVAVIGTGASAAQFIPAIQPEVERLVVFQRTPPWIMPRLDVRSVGVQRAAFRAVPPLQTALRGGIFTLIEGLGLVQFVNLRFRHAYEAVGRLQLRRQVRDAGLRARLTPDYMIGCKRAILTDAYLPALTQPNVDVVTERIREIRPHAVVTDDGTEHAVDTIIYGTGFQAPTRAGAVIHGRDGRSLVDLYDERPQSYLGAAYAGFPNLFTVLGPYGAAGNQSAIYMIEQQVGYIVDAVRAMRAGDVAVVEVRPQAQAAFLDEVDERSAGTVWVDGGCRSYYQTRDGHNSGLWPSWSFAYAHRTRRFDPSAYDLTPAA
ncbi:Baeyer-Villiger monooxygenase [Paraconexibacter sp. AEG42_29]|uniref:Baeyer-Villiger monooxygenase n=1 Tax=Paraconexibacter sp. AEG42_29 TaxID=2997339 RepID=A0AAU7AQN7_9ACTN